MSFKHTYFYAIFWQRFKRNHLAMSGACVVAALFVISLLAQVIAPWEPNAISPVLVSASLGVAGAILTDSADENTSFVS